MKNLKSLTLFHTNQSQQIEKCGQQLLWIWLDSKQILTYKIQFSAQAQAAKMHILAILLGFQSDPKRKKPLTIILDGSLNIKEALEFLELQNNSHYAKSYIKFEFPNIAMFKDRYTNHLHDILTQGKINKEQNSILHECLTVTDQ